MAKKTVQKGNPELIEALNAIEKEKDISWLFQCNRRQSMIQCFYTANTVGEVVHVVAGGFL